MARAAQALFWLVLAEGAILLLALPAVFLPTEWMDATHRALGLGDLPRAPIVQYLTRSASLLYALWGAFHLYVAFDVRRYLALLRFLALAKIAFGVGMTTLDVWAGLPAYWAAAEGPGIIVFAAAQYFLARAAD